MDFSFLRSPKSLQQILQKLIVEQKMQKPQHQPLTPSPCHIPSQYLTTPSTTVLSHNEFCYHPNQLCNFILYAASTEAREREKNKDRPRPRLLKWIAYACFCQPVLVKWAQIAVEDLVGGTGGIFGEVGGGDFGENLVVILEALNIFCLAKGFCLQVLHITKPPVIPASLQYATALWLNALPFLTKNHCPTSCRTLLSEPTIEPTLQLINFLNYSDTLKQKVQKCLQDNNNYQQDYINTASKSSQQQQLSEEVGRKVHIHDLDIEMAKYDCLVTAEYLPSDYKGEYLEVWVNRTVELNSLLGNFVCKEKFGEFQYVKGPLMYAMQKGIMLVLNNFEHISNQLLVGMRTLAQQMKIHHNQKTIQARGGFKILGLCTVARMSAKMRDMLANNQYIVHLELPTRSVLDVLPKIENVGNREYLVGILGDMEKKLGLMAAMKLWKRIQRARKVMIESQDTHKLWESFFTQGFKDSVQLQILDLYSKTDQTRTIHTEQHRQTLLIGRTSSPILKPPTQKIVKTQYALSILQRLALCSELQETPLLISETGCGKTTLVQYLAELGGHHLYVYNMSSGTDVMDLVGGFKPVDCRALLKDLFFRFIEKFRGIPGAEKNEQYLQDLMRLYHEDQLKRLLPSLSASITKIKPKVTDTFELQEWEELKTKFDNINANLSKIDSNLVFSFLEGNLIKALRNGDWVLIDEINMATNDVLQKIVPLIQGKSLLLYEKGDLTYIQRNENFRIIACMNPANDAGKKPLPANLMQKFTAINLPEPLAMDIQMMVKQIAPQLNSTQIVQIYFDVKKQKTISLRNLSRCLSYLNRNKDTYTFKRALYDALLLGFQHKQLLKRFEDLTPPKIMKGFTEMHGFLVETGTHIHEGEPQIFHLTETFLEHLKDFLRAIAGTELPVLLQGPTSAGKTSIIRYVASVSGHKCIRINNHEHTEIEEYLGNYFPDKQGKLVFREGPLVQAVRQGHWLILDELNLARTQILQCLNRLLDDNRELFIPEQQIHIKPHKNFRIFATQNPASYSGRKTLSRAFRNRFISLSFDDITIQDTMAIMKVRRPILNDSKQLSAYVKRVLESLQNYRQKQRVFSKDGVITIRDLLKWTGRKFNDKESFMREGYALLVERLRTKEEKQFVESVLLSGTKMEQFNMAEQYERVVNENLSEQIIKNSKIYVQMNKSFKRMSALTLKAVTNSEAVLLVGQTGCGKTTLAQLLASISGRKFHSINCHKHTQASDLLGCLRPCIKPSSSHKFQYVNGVVIDAMLEGAVLLIDEINTAEDSVLERLNQVLESGEIGVQRGEGWETVTARPGFCIIATMNPSGDYGKKQLSPALRNRFTEIWVQPITHPQYIQSAQLDIKQMICHKLSNPNTNNPQLLQNAPKIATLIYNFIQEYNCQKAQRYGLSRKMMTMRDIGWLCKFMCQCGHNGLQNWERRYYWALRILAVEGVNFMMGDIVDSGKLANLRQELIDYIGRQVGEIEHSGQASQLEAISIVKQLTFPLLIKTDLPLQLLGIKPDERIFFSPHTELSDLLGQFRPKGTDFIWQDQTLLKAVKNGERLALIDLNLAQQPVIEGINSLFDHRGSIFVVELNSMFNKNDNFKPIVVLKETVGSDRRGLPNSFLNRFIKIRVKDVSKGVKIRYLQEKYKSIGIDNKKLWGYIERVLETSPKVKIEDLEFVCSLYSKDDNFLQKAIQILSLPPLLPLSQTNQPQPLPILTPQQHLLTLAPLTHKHKNQHTFSHSSHLPKKQQLSLLINSYITLKYSPFSLCLIGNVSAREKMVELLGYVLRKGIVKVVLSTMTDMADLLGSYEQVDDHQEEQLEGEDNDKEFMDEEQSLSQATQKITQALSSIHKKSQKSPTTTTTPTSTTTNFKYIPSKIIKTVHKSPNSLLYIEVPNEMMLQRVEKGIKCVYQQQVSIVVGVDGGGHGHGNTVAVCRGTKLIPILLQSQPQPDSTITIDPSPSQSPTLQSPYAPNHSQLTHHDPHLRQTQTISWLQHRINEESNRQAVKAWQRLYANIVAGKLAGSGFVDQKVLLGRVLENAGVICRGLGVQVGEVQEQSRKIMEEYYLQSKKQFKLPNSKQQQQLLDKILKLFLHETLTSDTMTFRNPTFLEQQPQNQNQHQFEQIQYTSPNSNQYNATLSHKFKYLYISDLTSGTGFKQQATRLLTLLYNSMGQSSETQLVASNSALTKLQTQIQHLYTATTSTHSQLLIPYSETSHKLIPILHPHNPKSVFHYTLTNLPRSVNRIIGLDIDLNVIVGSEIQKQIIGYLENFIGVQVKGLGQWVWGLNVRDLVVFQMVAEKVVKDKMDLYAGVCDRIKASLCKNRQLLTILQAILRTHNPQAKSLLTQSPLQLALNLFDTFKPHPSPYHNLHFHIETESQLHTLQQLAQEDKYYLEVYRELCNIKYAGYRPNSYQNVEMRVHYYTAEWDKVRAKKYVYRGYDNLKALRDFYGELGRKCQEIEESNFDITVISTILPELYSNYYQTFKDILWPLLTSLILLHCTKITQKYINPESPSITQSILQKSNKNQNKSFAEAIKLIMHREEEEFHDSAKNYLKFQKKFKDTVIVDEYTEEGVAKNKENQEEQFKEFFGKTEVPKPSTVLDQLYMLVRKRVGCKYHLKLLKQLYEDSHQFYPFLISFHLKFPSLAHSLHLPKIPPKTPLNIYQEYSLPISNTLSSPIPAILQHTRTLLSKYNIDSVKTIGALCNKIQEHRAHDEVYKILVDCEFLVEKIYELYPVLPMAERIPVEELENLCMSVRRVQLQNWQKMLDVKISRLQKSDTLDFINFYRNFIQIGSIGQSESLQLKQCFKMCDDFIRQSRLSCFEYRIYLLQLVVDNMDNTKTGLKHTMNRIINFYLSLTPSISSHCQNHKKQRIKQVVEYQKLTKWDSNNFLIFKQTCQRFQKKIHRILKRYEEDLGMQVGVFHTNLRNKLICQSIGEFDTVYKMADEAVRMFETEAAIEQEQGQQEKSTISIYEDIVQRIFETLTEIKQDHHNTQSKMLLIRNNLSDLQQTLQQHLPKSPPSSSPSHSQHMQSKILAPEMFPPQHPEYYEKSLKYYFGMWDKFSQKTQTAWNRDVVERVWALGEKIWVAVNAGIPGYDVGIEGELDEETDDILILFEKFLGQEQSEANNQHPIFLQQLTKVKSLLRTRQQHFLLRQQSKYTPIKNPPQLVCLMKIGYIITSIALNLEKNGLCIKENQEEGEQSGTEEVGDGVGIGEGEAHEGAENVGDQIEFQEQLQGNKDEEKNRDANAGKKEDNDIEMQGDFQGDMYSKQQQPEGQDSNNEAQEKSADEQMGEVDNSQREQDIKNDKGKAQGSEEADIEIDGQQEGSEQLVDNQQEEKQGRKGQNREGEDLEKQGEQEEKSDWDDNNEQGEKINKQNVGEMEEEEEGEDDDGSGEELSSLDHEDKGSGSGQDDDQNKEEEGNEDNSSDNEMKDENQEEEGSQQGNKDGEIMQQQIQQEPIPQQQQNQQKQKKFKKTRRTNLQAFGRTDLNSSNPLQNNENQVENDQVNGQGQAQATGEQQGQKGTGEPIHSLSAELLKQIENLERISAKENTTFMKDLNVVANDQQNEEIQDENLGQEQQYELTEEQNKMSTNLPAFLDDNKSKKQEQNKKKEQEKAIKQRNQEKQYKKDTADKKEQKNKSKIQKSKNPSQYKQYPKQQQDQQPKKQQENEPSNTNPNNKDKNKQKPNKPLHEPTVMQTNQEQYLKSIVNANANSIQKGQEVEKSVIKDEDQERKDNIMEQAFEISKILEEQLKSVLQPMDNAEYRGDYKTGKKLNLKKIIPFIASNFRKDKIWLRRTEPSQRNYYIMLALDDTKSMRHGGVGTQALKGLLAISLALQHLSIKTCITGIRDSMNVYKQFQGLLEPSQILQSFDFTHESQVSHDLSIASFMQASLQQFQKCDSSETGIENRQLCFIISDGKMNKDYVRPYLRQAKKRDIIYVFIVVDSEKASILTTKSVSIDGNGKVKMKLYMSDFPFEYFLIVRNVQELGDVLATTLLQFIQEK